MGHGRTLVMHCMLRQQGTRSSEHSTAWLMKQFVPDTIKRWTSCLPTPTYCKTVDWSTTGSRRLGFDDKRCFHTVISNYALNMDGEDETADGNHGQELRMANYRHIRLLYSNLAGIRLTKVFPARSWPKLQRHGAGSAAVNIALTVGYCQFSTAQSSVTVALVFNGRQSDYKVMSF